MGGCLTAFDRADDGTLSGRRIWADLPKGIAPDGICLCADDSIWVANALGAEFVRVAEGGEILERVATATGLGSFACMLGGEDRKTLFMVTAATSDQVKAQEERTGGIETARTTVPGAGLP
jgi:sugar lactone lactonase YvrE